MLKKLMALLLAGAVCMGVLAACAKEDGNDGGTTASGTVQSDMMTSGTETLSPHEQVFEEEDFGGADFKTLYRTTGVNEYYFEYIWSEGFTGDAVGEAVRKRNDLVEDKYNVTITSERCNSPMEEASVRMQSGQVDFNLIYDLVPNMRDAALDGKLYDVHKLDYVNLDKSSWVPNAV
ncbi:MAG: hypothetical protein J6L96_03370, partial [Clostridia bacterium]|nr:hypothetical protein [Clostridia bacterium]